MTRSPKLSSNGLERSRVWPKKDRTSREAWLGGSTHKEDYAYTGASSLDVPSKIFVVKEDTVKTLDRGHRLICSFNRTESIAHIQESKFGATSWQDDDTTKVQSSVKQ